MSAPRPRVQWRLETRLVEDPPGLKRVTTGDTPLQACEAMVNLEVRLGYATGPRHAYVTDPAGDPDALNCASNSSWLLPDETGHELGTIQRIITYYPDSDYPDDELPCPRVLVVTPAERRLLSDLPGARQSRGISRQYIASERVEWSGLDQRQAERLAQWWDEALEEGGNWFVARRWPTPQGVPVHRRWKGPLRWGLLPSRRSARVWTVSGDCEVASAPPEVP